MTRIFDDAGTSFDDKTCTYDGAEHNLNRQVNFKPKFYKADKIKAIFQSSNITYNDPNTEYSSLLEYYAGADYHQTEPAETDFMRIKPTNSKITNIKTTYQ